MNLRKYLKRPSACVSQEKKLFRTMELEALETRLAPVVGAFAAPNAIGAGIGWDGVVELTTTAGANMCTGSLLPTGRHILTAAHCLTNAAGQINVATTRVNFDLPGRRIFIDVPQADYRVNSD